MLNVVMLCYAISDLVRQIII